MNARIHLEWVLIPLFCELTGYTDRAVRNKIHNGVWLENVHWKRAPDNHIDINLQAYYKWVEGKDVIAA